MSNHACVVHFLLLLNVPHFVYPVIMPVDGHSGCFHLGAITNNTAENICL